MCKIFVTDELYLEPYKTHFQSYIIFSIGFLGGCLAFLCIADINKPWKHFL